MIQNLSNVDMSNFDLEYEEYEQESDLDYYNNMNKIKLNVYDTSNNDPSFIMDPEKVLQCGFGNSMYINNNRLTLDHTVLDIAFTESFTNSIMLHIKDILTTQQNNINTIKMRYCINIMKEGYSYLNEISSVSRLMIEDDYYVSYIIISGIGENKHIESIYFLNCRQIQHNVINMLYSMHNLKYLYFYHCDFVNYSRSMLEYYSIHNNRIKVFIKDEPNYKHIVVQ